MTEYRQNFIVLVAQRDMLYVQLLICSAVGYSWYRLFFYRLFPLALALTGLIVAGAVAWGIWYLVGKNLPPPKNQKRGKKKRKWVKNPGRPRRP